MLRATVASVSGIFPKRKLSQELPGNFLSEKFFEVVPIASMLVFTRLSEELASKFLEKVPKVNLFQFIVNQ